MEWFTVGNLINCIVVMVAYGIKNELKHINQNIDSVKELVSDAKNTALKAHERIDYLIERRGKN
ncbi:MAG: hypothetical protein V4605_08895 [Pseudomonadota bacterium]